MFQVRWGTLRMKVHGDHNQSASAEGAESTVCSMSLRRDTGAVGFTLPDQGARGCYTGASQSAGKE